jgi:CDP-diacylglycerol--serine O-phosphatidyltransferase
MRIIDMISIADAFTILNALLGFSAIIAGIEGNLELAYLLVVLAVLADGLDGMVARRFGSKWMIGDFLDIMADTVSFTVAPSVLLWLTYRDGLGDPALGLTVVQGQILILFACCVLITFGILRLARFCFESGNEGSELFFTGLPVPATALLVVTMLLMGWPGILIIVLTVVASVMMVSDLKYPKARGKPGKIVGILGFLLVITTLAGEPLEMVSEFMMYLTFSAIFLYMFLGPFSKGKVDEYIEA